MNIRLKARFFERGLSQLQVARAVGISDSMLSKVVHGWIEPSKEIKAKVAHALGCKVEEIFK